MHSPRLRIGPLALVTLSGCLAAVPACRQAPPPVTVSSLLAEMTDLEALARDPKPFYTHATASSYSRESHKGGNAWFDNHDVGQYVRRETREGRAEHVLADLAGPGAVTRFWSANPDLTNTIRFYFDGEQTPRLAAPLAALFKGTRPPFTAAFSYISGTGGNLYFPLPFSRSLRITVEGPPDGTPPRLYYEVGHRRYEAGTGVETFDPKDAAAFARAAEEAARRLSAPASLPAGDRWVAARLTVPPNATRSIAPIAGPGAVVEWSARMAPRPGAAWRRLVLQVAFDGDRSIEVPLGDFFGSGPGLNPYENLFFSVTADGAMTSRLVMPFRESMALSVTNTAADASTLDLRLRVVDRPFDARDWHLRAQWRTLTRDSWPPFDTNVLSTAGPGKVVGTVYEIANPVLIWWGEGDQKVFVDGEAFPSTFGTGTEDDYGFAYGNNEPFTRPYHAQTRVDGPWSGGHVSLNRWYVLDALPFRTSIRFDQEMWHWMPCRPTWSQVIYWYAKPGTPGPARVDPATLGPVDLGPREAMEAFEGEALAHEETGGRAAKERLANCSGAEHLVWNGAKPGDRLVVRFRAPKAGSYDITLNLCQSPGYGRHRLLVNGRAAGPVVDSYSPTLYFVRPTLEHVDLREGENTLTAVALPPNPAAGPGNRLGLDYVLLVRR